MNMLFSFQGRIGRAQYWLTTFGVIAFYVAVFMAAGVTLGVDPTTNKPSMSGSGILLIFGAMIIGMWINLATMAKRYHDRNKSGWWFFICLVPIVGPIWQLVELGFLSGTPGGNDYGVRGQSHSNWNSEEQDDYTSSNSNLDDLIQQRLQERQQSQTPAVQRTSNAPSGLSTDRPVFGRRT